MNIQEHKIGGVMFKKLWLILAILLFTSNVFALDEWTKTKPQSSDNLTSWPTDEQANNNALDRLLTAYRGRMYVYYKDAGTVTVSRGTVACSDGSTNKFRYDSTETDVTFSNIDTGAEASSTQYYVYASCDGTTTNADFKISTNATTPTGLTSFKLIGSFFNNSSSNIDPDKVYAEPYGMVNADVNGYKPLQALFNYGSSSSAYTVLNSNLKLAFGNTGTLSSCGGTFSISNLPFSSGSSYSLTATQTDGGTVGSAYVNQTSGSATTITNTCVPAGSNAAHSFNWVAVGY